MVDIRVDSMEHLHLLTDVDLLYSDGGISGVDDGDQARAPLRPHHQHPCSHMWPCSEQWQELS